MGLTSAFLSEQFSIAILKENQLVLTTVQKGWILQSAGLNGFVNFLVLQFITRASQKNDVLKVMLQVRCGRNTSAAWLKNHNFLKYALYKTIPIIFQWSILRCLHLQ